MPLAIFTEDAVDDFIKDTFQSHHGVVFCARLGFGRDGDVYFTDRNTAVKFFKRKDAFLREREVYVTLADLSVENVAGHAVPQMLLADETLLAIEMTVVRPPFLLDFVSAYPLSEAPDFSDEVLEHWRNEKLEQFGVLWPEVENVLSEFQRITGYVLLDIHSGNIGFRREESNDTEG